MRTLDVTRLSNEHLGRLCTLEQLNWAVLNESVVRCLMALRNDLQREQTQNGQLRNEIRDLKAERDERQRNTAELQGEKGRLEMTVAMQTSEIHV
jgi:predicted nuclease with TOPRIM domain